MPLHPRILLVVTAWSCAEPPPAASEAPLTAPRAATSVQAPSWVAEVSARVRDASRAIQPADGGFRAELVERDLSARFDARGAHLTVGDDTIRVSTVGWGRDARSEEAGSIAPALGACVDELVDPAGDCIRRLEYAEPGRTEWWSSGEEGLEQGWTVERRLDGDGDLAVELAVRGATVSMGDGDLWLNGNGGELVLVTGLAAWDADGALLATRFEPTEGGFRIRVGDAGARYPITIDPVYTTPSWTVDGLEADDFGASVSGAGDVDGDGYADVIVGAPAYDTSTGRAYLFLGSAAGLSATASTTLTGEAQGNAFGIAVAAAGDVDHDGYDDVIVGAYGHDSYRGRAYVYPGSAAGTSTVALATFSGGAEADYFGRAVAGAGDVDNDGYHDVLVGAGGYDDLVGQVYVYHGSASGMDSAATTTLTGEMSMAYFGWTGAVAGAGDVDNDGYDDVIIGSTAYDLGAGRAYVYHGSAAGVSSTAALVLTGSADDQLGCAVAGVGDVDNDGYDDVIVGARGYAGGTGRAYVHHGSATGVSSAASVTLTGEAANDRFGDLIASAGDLNGDGYGDIAIGARGFDGDKGRVYTYHGSAGGTSGTSSTTITGSTAYENVAALGGAGDVDNDGYDDLIIGGAAAEASLHRGSASGLSSSPATTLEGVPSSEHLGIAVSGAGDVDNDGYADVIVGAYAWDGLTGRAFVFHGSATGLSTTARTTLNGEAAGHRFGSSVSGAGDVDGDGYDDVIVGACGSYEAPSDRAYLFHGSASGVSTVLGTTLAYDGTGCASSGAGDVDNDGYDDVIVGDVGASQAHVYRGSATGVSPTAATTLTGTGTFGGEVSDAGDVDNDGYADVIVGADGQAFVFHGSATGLETAATTTTYAASDDDVFRHVSGAGDVDNDGYDDVIVGATSLRYATYGSRAFVYHGSASGISSVATTEIAGRDLLFGASVSGAGDVDNDGYDDVIVGTPPAYGGSGIAEVFLGSATGLSTTAVTSLIGDSEHDDFGASVSGAGDVDNDGYDDVIVGAHSESSGGGRAYAFHGYGSGTTDADGDGHDSPDDCDDSNAAIHPGATETVADGIDQDCDGVDSCYTDADGDNYGTSVVVDGSSLDCAAGTGAKVATDCDDADVTVTDSGVMLYADADGDGFGAGSAKTYCADPGTGTSEVGGDCNDADEHVFPGASETCNILDDDCDALVDDADPDVTGAVTWHTDADGDGHGAGPAVATACVGPTGAVASSDDCDDTDATVMGTTTWYTDADDDGYGGSEIAADACEAPEGTSASFEDCDDGDDAVHPGATEACNGVDDDCDEVIDDGAGSTWYADVDEDGYGDPGAALASCEPPSGWVTDGSDCDDADDAVNPGAEEAVGDGIDGDCDGGEICYVDADDDGWHVADETVASEDALCDGAGEALDSDPTGDCDDGDAAYHPGAPEADCTDPNDYNCDGSAGSADADEDGFPACEDCDDELSAVNPDADEVCNAYDDDCDGVIDADAIDRVAWNADADADGYTNPDDSALSCDAPEGYAEPSAEPDCDDADGAVNPGAAEVADDGVDQNCDGIDATDGGPTDDDDDDVKVGCSCGTGRPPGMLLAMGPLLAALLLRRRR